MRIREYRAFVNDEGIPYLKTTRSTNLPELSCISSPLAIVQMMNRLYQAGQLPEEHFWAISLDTKKKVVGIFEMGIGTADCVQFNIAGLFRNLILTKSCTFIVVHNHPSGDVLPSGVDTDVTKQLKEAGKLLNFPLLDHVIIGEYNWYSFGEHNLI